MSGSTASTVRPVSQLYSMFADGQAAGTISPSYARDMIASLAAISGVTSVAGRTGAVTLASADLSGLSAAVVSTVGTGALAAASTLGASDTVLVKASGTLSRITWANLQTLLTS